MIIDDDRISYFISAIEMMFDGVACVDRNGCILCCDEKVESMSLEISSKDTKGIIHGDNDLENQPELLDRNRPADRAIASHLQTGGAPARIAPRPERPVSLSLPMERDTLPDRDGCDIARQMQPPRRRPSRRTC